MNFEQNIAIMDAYQAKSLEAFLNANPHANTKLVERAFSFAYRSAWNNCEQQQAEVIAKLEASQARWIPVDDKCKDGRFYIYQLQDGRIYYGTYCFHQYVHMTPKLTILVKDYFSELEFSDVVKYMELPE